MSDHDPAQTIEKKDLAGYVQRLEQELAAINAPFHVHQAQKQILSGFWNAVKTHGSKTGVPAPVVPVSKKGKRA